MAAVLVAGWAAPAAPGFGATLSCSASPPRGAPAAGGPLEITIGRQPAAADFPVLPGHHYLVQVEERDNDALVEVLDSSDHVLARADHPERRTGTRRSLVSGDSGSLHVRVTAKEAGAARGRARIQVFDLAPVEARPGCLAILKSLAAGDAEYAAGTEASLASPAPSTGNAREMFVRAAQAYASAERALNASADQQLRGETALALAGVDYFDLQDWAGAAEWAQTAARTLATDDSYRTARADALLAAAWIEIASTTGARTSDATPQDFLARARRELQRLVRFHLQRGERYDAGLQLTNIGVTYLHEGNYGECASTFGASSRLFGSIQEVQRRAQAWQDRALCLWGLGQLPEALHWLQRAAGDITPDPYPSLYIGVLTNTALAHYALGHFDDSLRLYDRALIFAEKVQYARDEAYCLYGIGVNYYALGDRQRARDFLERSLAIRSAALDGRGRMASLRALATIDAEQGRVEQALSMDREALSLAIAPSAIARIQIQQAVHTAADGRPVEAEALLDEVISSAAGAGPLIEAEARLQRAMLRRSTGRAAGALADLAVARPHLHRFGSVMQEFEADLELARTLRQAGQSRAALGAVDRALAQSDAVRLQSANPELRAQLQSPLRPAYDLKLELLRERYEHALSVGHESEANTLAAAAFTTADASRAHSFADVAAQKYSPALRQALAADFRRREELYRELAGRRFALDARLERSGSDDARVHHLMREIAELRRQVDTVNTAIAKHSQPAASARNAHEATSLPAPHPDTALISYWLGSESAYAWVVLPREVHWVRLASPKLIADEATAFHRSLTRLVDIPVERRLQDGSSLYETVIRPLEPSLGHMRSWVVIPDGALDYVPFAALPVRGGEIKSFLVMQHDVAVTPAAWMLDKTHGGRPVEGNGRILLVADPVYQADDPRLVTARNASTQSVAHRTSPPFDREYSRLRFSGEEAAAIAAQFPPHEVEELTGVDATRERLLSLDWSQYRFIHIATHGIVDAQVPELSSLILGSYDARGEVTDRALRVADLSLQSLNAEVAVLSACETALGTQVRSEGLLGMSSTMLARGARAVVASLWPVPDEISARLMAEFYRNMLQASMTPEAALGVAMRSAASREASSDPGLWGAFQVSVGDVRSPPAGSAAKASVAAVIESR